MRILCLDARQRMRRRRAYAEAEREYRRAREVAVADSGGQPALAKSDRR